jgi:subtilisin-like proprotein convertase family protein
LRDRVADLQVLTDLDLDVDGVFGTWARVHLLDEEADKLRNLGFIVNALVEEAAAKDPGTGAPPNQPAYHTYETLTQDLQTIAADHPDLVRLYSIGKSVQGRDLWVVKVTDNPDVQEDEPEVRYIAAMHGDEVVGKEMCVYLLDLLTDSYGTDPRITDLVDSTEIWILPSMNPDGTASVRRYNANNYDLNRNFPDQFVNPVDSPAGRQPETQHVMNWTYGLTPVLSANFHGGALVANYPYDSTPSGASSYSLCPDDSVFRSLARTYADNNPPMYNSNSDASFDRGICNGSDWYAIRGGMQDWHYVWRGGKDLTLEISNAKWPAADQLPTFWNDNRESMLRYLERVHEGLRGIVTDATSGLPVAATVRVAGSDRVTFTDPEVGDYHRLLLPGRYDLEFSATGYVTRPVGGVVVDAGPPAARLDVALEPLAVDLEPVAATVLDGGNAVLDAGESADLAVTLRNFGETATGIAADLVPTTWAASILRPAATYPDLPPGASGTSLAPHFGVLVDPDTPPGHKLGFALAWSSAEGAGISEPIFLAAGDPVCATVDSGNIPLAILDRQTTSSTLSFVDSREISSVDVRVDVIHPYVGDLHVRVVSPAGTPVTLHARTGGSSDDIHAWFDDDRAPAEPLSRLSGEDAAGTWTLEVRDGVPFNTGTLSAWSLRVCGRSFEATTPELKIRDVVRTPTGVRLRWWPYPGLSSYTLYRSTVPGPRSGFVDVTGEDADPTDTVFDDATGAPLVMWLVTGTGPAGEGPR